MGVGSSKHKYPFPAPYGAGSGYPPYPGPYGPSMAPGMQQQGFVPPGFGPQFPVPQHIPQAPEKRKKRKKPPRLDEPMYPGGYVPSTAVGAQNGFPQPAAPAVIPTVKPSRSSRRSERDRERDRRDAAPFIPPFSSQNPPAAPPPPLFTPGRATEPLNGFPSPNLSSNTNANRRPQTPFIPPGFAGGLDSDDGEPPPQPNQQQGAFGSNQQQQPIQQQSNFGAGIHQPPPDQPRVQPPLPPPQPNIGVIQPMEPANPSAYGPPPSGRRPSISNPLPPPPRDLYEMSPYKSLLNLPQTTALLTATYGAAGLQPPLAGTTMNVNEMGNQGHERKKSKSGGLFRSLSRSQEPRQPQATTENVRFVPVFLPPPGHISGQTPYQNANGLPQSQAGQPPGPTSASTGTFSNPNSASTTAPVIPNLPPFADIPRSVTPVGPPPAHQPTEPPAIRFDQQSSYSGFMNHSPHRVLYQNKTYPSATHLHEALKYLPHRPDLAESIRLCPSVNDVYPLSARYQPHQRADWGEVFLKTMEDVLHAKFRQHPDLRSLLLGTVGRPLVYVDPGDAFWGEGPGNGKNELGKALVRVREKLLAEGYTL